MPSTSGTFASILRPRDKKLLLRFLRNSFTLFGCTSRFDKQSESNGLKKKETAPGIVVFSLVAIILILRWLVREIVLEEAQIVPTSFTVV